MKKISISIGILVVLALAFLGLNAYIYEEKQDGGYMGAVYFLSGEEIRIGSNGLSYFGNEVRGDLDGDGDEDIAFLVTHSPGGSGTFFYLAGAIMTDGGYRGTNLMFIGDRIAPQTMEYRDLSAPYGVCVIVNYADRAPGEPFTTVPSVGKSLYAKYSPDTNDFGEVVQDFEGESR
jgi:hypothetical protein